jgi:hypothetical protein
MPAFPVTSGLTLYLYAGSGVTVSGTRVSQWNDLSGSGNHVTQSTGSEQPYYMASHYKSQPFIGFSGAQCLFNPAAWVASGTGSRTVMTFQVPSTTLESDCFVNIGPNSATTNVMGYTWETIWGWTGGLDDRNYGYGFSTINQSEPMVTCTTWAGGTGSGKLNRYRNKLQTEVNNGGLNWNTSSGVIIGAFKSTGGYSFPQKTPINSVAIWNRVLTTAERESVVDHFLNNYAPSDFAVSGVTATSATLTWTNGWNDNGKEIYRSTTNDTGTSICVGKAISGTTSFVDSTLAASTTYYWWTKNIVTSYNVDYYTSSFSSVVSGTTTTNNGIIIGILNGA